MIRFFTRLAALGALVTASAQAEDKGITSVFGPGEQATYEVSYLGIVAGTVQVTVGAEVSQNNGPVWPIVIIARSSSFLTFYPVRDKFVTYWNPRSQLSATNELLIDENHRRTRQVVVLDQSAHTAFVTKQREGGEEIKVNQPIAPGTVDMAAAALSLRNRPLTPGALVELPVFTGKKNFVLKVHVESKSVLHTPLGTKQVVKARVETEFSGKLRSTRDMFVFFSTDARHLLLRVEADLLLGSLTGELIDYKPGQDNSRGSQ
jgi:hypothetical protein